jgi:citrate lyase subunit beta/citryl-CoA lyase
MRSLLLLPVNRAGLVEQARQSAADVIVLDLATLAPNDREAARRGLRETITALKGAGKGVHVRVNHADSGHARDDLAAAVGPGLDGLAAPMTLAPRDIRQMDVLIREQETHNGVRPGEIVLIPCIESPRGLLRCAEIIEASTRIAGLALGTDAFAAALGVSRTAEGRELDYARQVIVNVCAAYGLQALDGTTRSGGDTATEARAARVLGFKGKYISDASQAGAVNEAFA